MATRVRPEDKVWISFEAAKRRYELLPKLKTKMHVVASQMKIDLDKCTKDEFVAICELAYELPGSI